MQRQEIANNSDEQVIEYIAKARALCDQLNLSEQKWIAVFTAAVGLYSGKQIVMVQPQPLDLSHLGNLRNGLAK